MRSGLARKIARTIVRVRALRSAVVDSNGISFHRVDAAGLAEVGAFRVRYYAESASPYLLAHLDERGLDDFDQRAFVYAARVDDRIVATLRAVPAPFEIDRYVARERLQVAVGGDLNRYLEVSRMLVSPDLSGRGLGSATIGFAGVDVLMNTNYRGYFAYIRVAEAGQGPMPALPGVKSVLKFHIPTRGEHDYTVVAGTIGLDTLWRGVSRVRTAAGRRVMTVREGSC